MSLAGLRKEYSYAALRKNPNYSWAQEFRAGIILKYSDSVLMVQQRSYGNNLPTFGFPKGGYERKDGSVVDNAIRELREETGIDVSNYPLDPWFSQVVIRVDAPSKQGEVHFYFIVEVGEEPAVSIDYRELISYKWVPLSELSRVKPVSRSTQMVLQGLSRINMASRCTLPVSPLQEMFI